MGSDGSFRSLSLEPLAAVVDELDAAAAAGFAAFMASAAAGEQPVAAAAAGLAAFVAAAAWEQPDAAAAAGLAAFIAACSGCSSMMGGEATLEAVHSHLAAVALGHAASTVAIPPPHVGRDLVCFHGLLFALVHVWIDWRLDPPQSA